MPAFKLEIHSKSLGGKPEVKISSVEAEDANRAVEIATERLNIDAMTIERIEVFAKIAEVRAERKVVIEHIAA